MRLLLIQPPFWGVNSPSIGLSSLRAAVKAAGMEAEIWYANLDFAARIGRADYDLIQAGLPVDLLFGDLVFAAALRGASRPAIDIPARLRAILSRPPALRAVSEAFLERFPSFSEEAVAFVESLRASVPWRGWDLVGFTTTFTLVPALAMAKTLKESGGTLPIVFGGSHCDGPLGNALMEHYPWVDYVVRGEGERSLVDLMEQLDGRGKGVAAIDGLLWREDGHVQRSASEMARIEDLDTLPLPAYDDWFQGVERHGWGDPNTLRLPIETSRGCWYGDRRQCTFCGLNGLNDAFRAKSGDRILQEYASLLDYGVPFFNAVDNVLDPHHFRDALPRIAALEKKATLFFEIRPTLTRGQLLSLKQAGVRFLQPGIESLNTRLLSLMNKGTTAAQNIRLLRWTAELGMPVFWNMLVGLPGETAADYDEMTALIPALTHLFPPLATCNRIHVDRFSPLFNQHLDAIQPIEGYELALGLPPKAVRDLAYHFEFDAAHQPEPAVIQAIARLNEAVITWQNAVGTAAFLSLDRDGKRWLYDTRPGAVEEEVVLEGTPAVLYGLLEKGCSHAAIVKTLCLSELEVDAVLARFQEARWIIKEGDLYLGVAVPMDGEVPSDIPAILSRDFALNLYQYQTKEMWGQLSSTITKESSESARLF